MFLHQGRGFKIQENDPGAVENNAVGFVAGGFGVQDFFFVFEGYVFAKIAGQLRVLYYFLQHVAEFRQFFAANNAFVHKIWRRKNLVIV
jgi:hypothetical protein